MVKFSAVQEVWIGSCEVSIVPVSVPVGTGLLHPQKRKSRMTKKTGQLSEDLTLMRQQGKDNIMRTDSRDIIITS